VFDVRRSITREKPRSRLLGRHLELRLRSRERLFQSRGKIVDKGHV
jgi:hypothetical protein